MGVAGNLYYAATASTLTPKGRWLPVSVGRIVPWALCGLAAICVFSLLHSVSALPPNNVGSESLNSGASTTSAQAYKWVDSTAPGCLAPSAVGPGIPAIGSPQEPARGCPLGWDEIAGAPGTCKAQQASTHDYYHQ